MRCNFDDGKGSLVRYPRERLLRLFVLVLGVVTATVLAIVILVYLQVSNELNNRAVESVRTQLAALQRSIVNQLRYSGDVGVWLLRSFGDHEPHSRPPGLDLRVNQAMLSLTFARKLIVTLSDGSSFASFGAPDSTVVLRATRGVTSELSVGSFSEDALLRDAGGWYLAPAYRDSINLSTHLPIVVYEFAGVERVAIALAIVDLSELLFDLKSELHIAVDGESVPISVWVFDSSGRLLETTRNFPVKRYRPLQPHTDIAAATGVEPGALLQVSPADLTPVVDGRPSDLATLVYDRRTGFLIYGSVHGPTVLRRAGRLSTQILIIGVLCVAAILALSVALLKTVERLARSEHQRAGMRVKVLQATMNPHFLFNTLDTMVGLAYKRDFEGLVEILRALSHQLRGVVRTDSDLATLADEVEYVKSYLNIQRHRYADGFSWALDIPDSCAPLLIPRFCLQPLVENCFTHAIPFVDHPLQIRIVANIVAEQLTIEVSDNGPGCLPERLTELRAALQEASQTDGRNVEEAELQHGGVERHGIGIYSVHRRLGLAFGPRYGLVVRSVTTPAFPDCPQGHQHVQPEPRASTTRTGGFIVSLRLPCLSATSDIQDRQETAPVAASRLRAEP